uniref:40S ribosomal protein S21 n=2 Tax=Ursus TaxID=9639 RepID=A0A452T4I4_URSMA
MQNDTDELVDLYVLLKCTLTNGISHAKDHTSIQMNMAKVDKMTCRFNGQFKTYAICGAICRMVSQMTPSSHWPRVCVIVPPSG